MAHLPESSISVEVFALPTGKLYLPDRWLFEDGDEDIRTARQYSPDYSFLIHHPSGRRILFDLGMRKDLENYPPIIVGEYPSISPEVPMDAAEILNTGPHSADSISAIVLSHLHFDHIGDCDKFLHASVIVGPGSRAATMPGYPSDIESPFLGSVLDHPGFREFSLVSDKWVPVGPFPRAYDYFGDGSFYILDTPGHMQGHLSGLAQTGPQEWVFMGGDCCHHRDLLSGKRPVSITVGPNGTKSFHQDPQTAIKTMDLVRTLEADGRVLVALAHDATLENGMPLYPQRLNGWKEGQWNKQIRKLVAQIYGV